MTITAVSARQPILNRLLRNKMRLDRRNFFIAVTTLLLVLAALGAPLPQVRPTGQARHIRVEARQFAFDPGSIRVDYGDIVTLDLEAMDAIHGLYLDGYGVNLKAEPGHRAQTTFVADKVGKFKFRCSVSCGGLHPFMIGELRVGSNLPFARAIAAMVIAATGGFIFFRKNE